MRFKKYIYTEEQLREACTGADSVSDVCRALGVPFKGSNHTVVRDEINACGIDISHFTGAKNRAAGVHAVGRPIEDYLNNKYSTNASSLRIKLIKQGYFMHQCMECKAVEWKWKNSFIPIPLNLHHINGNDQDNSLTNIEILCSNCHSCTDNFAGKKNKKEKLPRIRHPRARIPNYKIMWPSNEELQNLISNMSMAQISKQLGVSDRAIDKRCKKLGIKKLTN